METLKNILSELRITNEKELKNYIDDNYYRQDSIPLKIIKKEDLRIDSENRVYNKNMIFKKTIFDIDDLKILNSNRISFQDCIFTGSLRVANKEKETPTEIFFDTVIIKTELYLSGAFNISKCTFSDINSPALYILNNDLILDLSISRCYLGILMFYNNNIKSIHCSFNNINYFETSFSKFHEVDFPNGQINISIYDAKSISSSKEKKIKKNHKYLLLNNSINLEKFGRNEKFQKNNETSNFLLKYSDYHLNRGERARLKYISGLSSISSPISRVLYRIFGGLIIPYRIVLLMLIITISFSLVYFLSGADFSIANTTRKLCLAEAIYFSGISFTTIGYGDIAPIGNLRYISIIEGIIGIIFSGAFVISLTRRYIE